MHKVITLILLAPFLVNRVVAHGAVTGYIINDKEYTGYQPYEPPDGQATIARPFATIDPIFDPQDEAISCNNDGGPVGKGGEQLSAPINAGDTITAIYGLWIHPYGPAAVYMARCPGACVESNSRDLLWFKINHVGLIDGNLISGNWGSGIVSKTGIYNATIPSNLADGEYLIRHELVAIHPVWTGPQFYIECAQLRVTNGGGKHPAKEFLVTFPGAYNVSDPGLNVNIYAPEAVDITTYEVPGPPVWDGEDASVLEETLYSVSGW